MVGFYQNITPVRDFNLVAHAESYRPVPEDWWVIITDVVNSTEAIARGFYKEVNTAGAISLVALANLKLHLKVPVVFGGDGITLLTPPDYLESLKDIFFGIREFVERNFALKLRVGLVAVRELYAAREMVYLGKFSSVNPFSQAIFTGSGIDAAEAKIKSGKPDYLLPADYAPTLKPDFSGFSCPFRDIRSDGATVLSLIIKSRKDLDAYNRLIPELLEKLGPEKEFYPVSWSNLSMGKTPSELSAWATVAAGNNKGFKFYFKGVIFSLMTRMLSLLGKKLQRMAEAHMPLYTDHKKFDGTLKMVVRATPERREAILHWLEEHEKTGDIWYGLFESDATLITCVFNGTEDEREIHLIDGSNGGYALAAKSLKEKIRRD